MGQEVPDIMRPFAVFVVIWSAPNVLKHPSAPSTLDRSWVKRYPGVSEHVELLQGRFQHILEFYSLSAWLSHLPIAIKREFVSGVQCQAYKRCNLPNAVNVGDFGLGEDVDTGSFTRPENLKAFSEAIFKTIHE